MSATKALFQRTWNQSEDQAFHEESRLQFKLLRGKNQAEAMAANFKKRAPTSATGNGITDTPGPRQRLPPRTGAPDTAVASLAVF